MLNRLFILLIAVLFCSSSFRVIEDKKKLSENLLWSSKYELSWEDFKGSAKMEDEYDAVTWTLIKRNQKELLEDKTIITVETFFLRNKSWVKEKKKGSNLLKHERLHWDITELYARKLRKIYSEHISEDMNESYDFFNYEYNQMLKRKEKFQSLYDGETDYSNNDTIQNEWNKKVTKLLLEYSKYSDINVEVRRK